MTIEGKRIIVTGSASGMGESTLNAYVQAGAHVIGMDVSDEKGSLICDKANESGLGKCSYIHVDVSDKSSVMDSFSKANDILGGLDTPCSSSSHPTLI